MDKDLEKAIKKDESAVRAYLLRSKIAQSGYMEHINGMIKEERTYKEIMDFMAAKGITITPAQISRHKQMLPYVTEVELVPDEESDLGRIAATKDRLLTTREMTNVELAIETLQQTVQASQITAVNDLWGDVIPTMIENIKQQIQEGHRISFKDTIDGLDKIVKIAQLLENKPTVIQAATVNGKTEVEHKHSIESIGDGSAESVSDFALDAIMQVNSVLQNYAKGRGDNDGDSTTDGSD